MKEKLNMRFEAKPILKNNFSEILKLLKKILSTAVGSNPPVSCTKSIIISAQCPLFYPLHHNVIYYYLCFPGDENTADVGTDDQQLLAYHFHIPEGLCGKLPHITI